MRDPIETYNAFWPSVIQQESRGERVYDLPSRLLRERIIFFTGGFLCGQIYPEGTGYTDQGRPPDNHLLYCSDRVINGSQAGNDEFVGKPSLIDHLNRCRSGIEPDGANLFAIYLHDLTSDKIEKSDRAG